jgi:hypothetical protein
MTSKNTFDIAVLLPTRGRKAMLERSIHSLINLAENPQNLQLLFGFDQDDDVGKDTFVQDLGPWLDHRDISYRALTFPPLGYLRLNEYVNALAKQSDAQWMIFWNDDAVMETPGWDREIMRWKDKFRLLAVHTHREHPYSIFPIVPRAWLDLLGYLSPHQISDAWLSQQAYMLDILERIPVHVLHDRFDLTGANNDNTFRNRPMLENNPRDPRDFHSSQQSEIRFRDCIKLATYMKNVLGHDMTFFENVCLGQQDPWEKLKINDVNNQMVQFANPAAMVESKKFAVGVKK